MGDLAHNETESGERREPRPSAVRWQQHTEIDLRRAGTALDTMESDASLREPRHLGARSRALDELAFLQELMTVRGLGVENPIVARICGLQLELSQIDEQLYGRLRRRVRSGTATAAELRAELERYASGAPARRDDLIAGYDTLDVLVHGVFLRRPTPDESVARSLEMVQYEATPARAVLAMIDDAKIGPADVFYDLGAGLGHVVLLVRLLTGATAYGVELDPAFCAYGRASAADLGMAGVRFIAADARQADLGRGTVYFMFTPFRGGILRAVLDRLEQESAQRPIRVCTYGTCTHDVARMGWLKVRDTAMLHDFRLAVFHSRPGAERR